MNHEVFLEQQAAQLGTQMPPAGQQQPAYFEQEHTAFEEDVQHQQLDQHSGHRAGWQQ